ncbi:MAG: hypothetical protein QM703_08140 [Gemmatales bacterium]
MKPASARQVERTIDLIYQQDTWWNIGRRAQQLTVRCQCTGPQRLSEYLAWQVPAGWSVKSVTSDSATPIQAWTWHADHPLEVQWPTNRKAGEKNSIVVLLEPASPSIVTEEPRVWFIPHLIPLIPGRFTGSYAVSMERTGELLPPSLVVIKSPGIRISPPSSAPTLWSSTKIVPDLYWQLQDASSAGSVQMQDWPASVRASLVTEVLDSEGMPSLRYRMKLQPLAGLVTRWPITFSTNPPQMTWVSTGKRLGEKWTQQSATSGQFTWQEPLDATIELESRIPWTFGTSVPLLASPMPCDTRLKLGRFLMPPSDWIAMTSGIQKDDIESIWPYDNKTISPVIKRLISDRVELTSPRIDTAIHNSLAESTYSTILPAHQDTLQLTLPNQGELISFEVDGALQAVKNPITIPPSLRPVHLVLKYRSRVNDGLLVSTWQPVLPVWNKDTTPPPLCHVTPDRQQITIWGSQSSSDQASKSHSMIWVSVQFIFVVAVLFVGLCWWVFRLRALRHLQAAIVLACCLLLMGGNFRVIAQGERTALVYILPGEAGKEDDERVMVPASLWKQIQNVAQQTTAGLSQSWWISETSTEAQWTTESLKLSSTWTVALSTDDTVGIPWLYSRPPDEVTIDKKTIQPRLMSKPFGLQQWVIPMKGQGSHEMVIKWENQFKQDGSMQSVEVKHPGAPRQKLAIHHVPDKLYLQGTSGIWKNTQVNGSRSLIAEAGLAKSVTLSWILPKDASPEAVVDVGVLWEYRIHQSIAHAVLSYHIDQGMLDQLTIELPADLRVRSLNIAGEVQATVSPRIKQWRIEQVESKQRLVVHLQRPVNGAVHLLLEMPSQRTARDTTVFLEHVRPLGVAQRHGIAAFLADGVLVEPLSPLETAQPNEIDFALPWLPSLASLPATSITRAVATNSTVPQLRLLPLHSNPFIKTENHIVIEPQSVQYRFKVEAHSQQPLVYLNAHIDPGLVINEVVGTRVSRWFQTTDKPNEPSQLSIWFTPGNRQSQEATFSIVARRPIDVNDEQRIRLTIKQIKWDTTISQPTVLKLFNNRSGKVINIQSNTLLRSIPGPWDDSTLIAAYELPASLTPGSAILLQEENVLLMPKASLAWDYSMAEKRWVLTLTAPAGSMLPTQIDMLALNDHLEQNWQFEANVPLSFRPTRSLGRAILWSLQLSKPVNKVQIKCYPLRDAQGKSIQPTVSFPAWQGMTITPAE